MNTSDFRYTLDRVRLAWRRHCLRHETDRIYDEIVGGIDQAAFRETFRPFWDPFAGAGAAKYLTLEVWLRETIFRYLLCTTDADLTGPVVDLGSGTGYFLWVCRAHGHDVLGIDIGGEPLYDAVCAFLDVPRIEFRIEPLTPLVETPGELCLVTAFMACFDRDEDGRPWGVEAWRYFLGDVRSRVKRGGRLVISFNADAATGEVCAPQVQRLFASSTDYHYRRFLNYAIFTAR